MQTRNRRGFTLVELLVVIGIVALLIGILLPSLAKARRTANAVKCLSNLHQIGLAAMMHANEHHGFIPPAGVSFPTDLNYFTQFACYSASGQRAAPWQADLGQYMAMRLTIDTKANVVTQMSDPYLMRPFTCPSQSTPIPLCDTLQSTYGIHPQARCSYGFNEQITGDYPASTVAAEARRLGGKIDKVRRQSETVLYYDALPRTGSGSGTVFPTVYQYYGDASAGTPPFATPYVGTLAESWLDTTHAYRKTVFDVARHDKRMNVTFADGHAAGVDLTPAALGAVIVDGTLVH